MNRAILGLLILVTVLALSSCNRNREDAADDANATSSEAAADDASTTSSGAQEEEGAATDSASTSALASNYEGALPPTNQLIIGIFRLEETDNAVNSAQAATMLPLWLALQSGAIQNQTERQAVLRQIEGALSEAQLEAIGSMQLTFADMNDWAQANGIELPQFGQGGQAGQNGQNAQAGPGGQGGPLADMSEEERAAFRQEMQDLSPEERAERLQELGVEVPEGGGQRGGGQGGPAGAGRFALLMDPLIELLQSKASI